MIRKAFATLSAILLLTCGGALGVQTASAGVQKPSNIASVTTVQQGGTWLPYDRANITTMAKCESRLAWLRKNVSWINSSNSKCTSVKLNVCPPKTVYWMMVLDHQAAAPADDRSTPEAASFALAC